MIILQSTFDVHPEKVEDALELMRDMMRLCEHEHGCRHYRYFQGIAAPGEVVLLQEWEDADCLQGHYETDHMAKFVNLLGPLLRSPIVTRSFVSEDDESVFGADADSASETRQAVH